MTIIQNAIMTAIKEHIKSRTNDPGCNDWEAFLKGMKFVNMTYDHERGAQTMCAFQATEEHPEYDDMSLSRYTVKTRFKAAKYENNVAVWQVNIYSNGDIAIYFDGTTYDA